MIGKVHNAKLVTFDDRDCWVAVVCDDRGKFSCRTEDVSDHDTKEQAINWLRTEARRRDLRLVRIEVREDDLTPTIIDG